MREELFYLQNGYVGNEILWWGKAGGYTTDLDRARVFTREQVMEQLRTCPERGEVAWPKSYIDARTHRSVDSQDVKITEARPELLLVGRVKELETALHHIVNLGTNRTAEGLRDIARTALAGTEVKP